MKSALKIGIDALRHSELYSDTELSPRIILSWIKRGNKLNIYKIANLDRIYEKPKYKSIIIDYPPIKEYNIIINIYEKR